ncbi:hypothetical protein, partial [Xanthomonas graminis]
ATAHGNARSRLRKMHFRQPLAGLSAANCELRQHASASGQAENAPSHPMSMPRIGNAARAVASS